jgi:hypothetical protein
MNGQDRGLSQGNGAQTTEGGPAENQLEQFYRELHLALAAAPLQGAPPAAPPGAAPIAAASNLSMALPTNWPLASLTANPQAFLQENAAAAVPTALQQQYSVFDLPIPVLQAALQTTLAVLQVGQAQPNYPLQQIAYPQAPSWPPSIQGETAPTNCLVPTTAGVVDTTMEQEAPRPPPAQVPPPTQVRTPTPAGLSQAPIPLYLDYDEQVLTTYQCLLRKQIELFAAGPDDVRGSAQGRNTPIGLGQVGIRCRHCAFLPKNARARGAVYYSKTIDGLYQVAQNMSKLHLCKTCHKIPTSTRAELVTLHLVKNRASGGKEYWSECLQVLGVYEGKGCLRLRRPPSVKSSEE